ncbi:hypothetical protein FIBSPDRAFT_875142 [Athelia psychrophila]|uniref:Uncharacterized protein n=1 Tax=Athelia psychrophila TaxID=1759441 RepID=A0A165WPX5_9AGAM|nr:hypothetical protein FIBSPDRAFT_875142 [Fibularhizoctonia sp. CBS 109695]
MEVPRRTLSRLKLRLQHNWTGTQFRAKHTSPDRHSHAAACATIFLTPLAAADPLLNLALSFSAALFFHCATLYGSIWTMVLMMADTLVANWHQGLRLSELMAV